MWSNQATRWIVLIGSIWSLMAIARCVLHQSFALPPETDAKTTALINVVFGCYFGVWLVLCQKLIFSADWLVTRLLWVLVAVVGLWGLSPDSQELLQAAETNFERFASSRGSAGGIKGASIWLLGVGAAMSLWLAHPLFRGLKVQAATGEASTTPILLEPTESTGLVRYLWLLRIALLVGFTYWLKFNIDVRHHPSEAFSYWLILLVVTSLGASLATFPYYIAIVMRRRWLGLVFFTSVWVGAPSLLIALIYVFQPWWPILPKSVVDLLSDVIAPFQVGFSLVMLVAFGSSCLFRDRAILTMPRAFVSGIRDKTLTDELAWGGNQKNAAPKVLLHAMLVAVVTLSLFGAIDWGGRYLQRKLHLGTWWMTDANHWGRATALARLQHFQDSDPEIAKKFQMPEWRYERPLVTSLDGSVQCVVSVKMANEPGWKRLREEVELNFKDVFWTMDFPVSDPADISGSAYSLLKIDGEKLRLRDLPTVVYPLNWEVFGGIVEDADYVRAAGCQGVRFERCQFNEVDFQRPIVTRFVALSLNFADCKFSEFPRHFPDGVHATYTLSRPEEFLENHEQFIEAIFNGCRVDLVELDPSRFDGQQFLAQIPQPWRHLIRILQTRTGEHVTLEQQPILSLYTSTNELPANFKTRLLETNASGQVIGLDFRYWQWSRHESIPATDHRLNDFPLAWIRILLGTGYEADEVAHLAALVGRSWLLQVPGLNGTRVEAELLSAKLASQNFVDSGQALYISGRLTLLDQDLINVFSSREILVIDCQAWPPGFGAGLVKAPQLKRIVVLITGDSPDATEAVGLQFLQAVPGLKVEVLRRPKTPGDLVRLLQEREAGERSP